MSKLRYKGPAKPVPTERPVREGLWFVAVALAAVVVVVLDVFLWRS